MNEFDIIKKYFAILTKNNPGALDLNDDVFFDKKTYLGLTPLQYKSEIADLIIFFITSLGFLKFI